MAPFTKDYVPASPNTPILASSWNSNNEANQQRFQLHEHNGIGENGPKIGTTGLDTNVNARLAKITDLEDAITEMKKKVDKLMGLIKQPVINRITDDKDNTIDKGTMGGVIKIHGSDFYEPLTVRFKSIVVPADQITIDPGHNFIKLTIPNTVESGSQYISVSVGNSAISEEFRIQ